MGCLTLISNGLIRSKHARKWFFWPWADYRVLRDAAAVLFTAEEERRLARQSFWLYSAKEVVVNLRDSATTWKPRKSKSSVSRVITLSYLASGLVLFLGRIHRKKGCDLAIRSFAQVFGSHSEWHLVMAGPDQTGLASRAYTG